jgi:hypothetical protein
MRPLLGPLRQQRALIGRSELESIIEKFAVQGVEADRWRPVKLLSGKTCTL